MTQSLCSRIFPETHITPVNKPSFLDGLPDGLFKIYQNIREKMQLCEEETKKRMNDANDMHCT